MGIKLDLSIAETNGVLGALAKQPFEAVASLINKIQAQGAPQVAEVQAEEKAAAEEAKAESDVA